MIVVDKSALVPCFVAEVAQGEVFMFEATPYIRGELDEDGDYLALDLLTGNRMFFEPNTQVVLRADAELLLG